MNSRAHNRAAAIVLASASIFAGLAGLTALAACSGEVSLGRGQPANEFALADGSAAEAGDCPMSQCAHRAIACGEAVLTNARCVPDPHRGQGSDAIDACVLLGDCVCAPSTCARQQFACAIGTPSNLRCVLNPDPGENGLAANACVLTGDCPDARP